MRDKRNCYAYLLGQLAHNPFCNDFSHNGKYFYSTKFSEIYNENMDNDMVNEDIMKTYQAIISL